MFLCLSQMRSFVQQHRKCDPWRARTTQKLRVYLTLDRYNMTVKKRLRAVHRYQSSAALLSMCG